MTAVDAAEAVATDDERCTELPVPGADPGRPAQPWEWQRAVNRSWRDIDGYVAPRTGKAIKHSTVKHVALVLAGRCDKDGVTDSAFSTLARDAGYGTKAVADAIACLEAFGWVRVHRDEADDGRKRGSNTKRNRYYLCFPQWRQGPHVGVPEDVGTSPGTHLDPSRRGRRAGQGPSATPHVKREKQDQTSCDCEISNFNPRCPVPAPACSHKEWITQQESW